jgi:hypothetical protein
LCQKTGKADRNPDAACPEGLREAIEAIEAIPASKTLRDLHHAAITSGDLESFAAEL